MSRVAHKLLVCLAQITDFIIIIASFNTLVWKIIDFKHNVPVANHHGTKQQGMHQSSVFL